MVESGAVPHLFWYLHGIEHKPLPLVGIQQMLIDFNWTNSLLTPALFADSQVWSEQVGSRTWFSLKLIGKNTLVGLK